MKTESTRPRSRVWLVGLFALLFGATFLNYSQRFVFTQNTTKIQRAFNDESGNNSTI